MSKFAVLTCLVLGASLNNGALAQGSLFDKAQDFLQQDGSGAADLTAAEIGEGLREALRVGTERVVGQLGQTDGFNAGQVTLLLKRLRVHGVIKRVGRHYKYYLTEFGRQAATMALKLREMVIIPSFAYRLNALA